MTIYAKTIKFVFFESHPTTGIFLDAEKAFEQVWYDGLLFKLTSMGLNRNLIRWIRNFLYESKPIVPIHPITSIHSVPQGSPLSLILAILYMLAPSLNLLLHK